MAKATHVAFWLLCGEWVLIFRLYPSAPFFCGLVAVTCCRFLLVHALFPTWQIMEGWWFWAFVACLNHLRLGVTGWWDRRRRQYDLPKEGMSWLLAFVRHPRLTAFVEAMAVAMVYILLLSRAPGPGRLATTRVLLPIAPDQFPAWATGQCVVTTLAYMIYNRWLFDLRYRPRRAQPPETQLGFGPVQAQPHPPLPLPSVKDLAEQWQQWYD